MKVCFITANYPPEVWGGTEHVVVALARELVSASASTITSTSTSTITSTITSASASSGQGPSEVGNHITVAVISGSDAAHVGPDLQQEQHDGVAVTRVFRKPEEHDRHGFVRPRILLLVKERLTEFRPDVVHVHSFAGLSLGITAICRELDIPVVVTFHDLWVTCARYFRLPAGGVTCPTGTDRTPCVTCVNDALFMDPIHLKQALLARDDLMQKEIALASACTAPSQTAANFVRDGLPFAGDIEIVPHGLLRDVPENHLAMPPSEGERLRIGTFGGLVEAKGVRELVQASVAVVQSGLACELHFSGPWHDEALAAELRLLAKDGGLDLIEHGPFTPSDRHPARALHLAVFVSKCQETYGLVVDEALAHGVPVVVSDFGALAERKAALGVVVTSLDALANVLAELIGSPQRLSALRDAIPQHLPTMRVSARRHLALYRTLR